MVAQFTYVSESMSVSTSTFCLMSLFRQVLRSTADTFSGSTNRPAGDEQTERAHDQSHEPLSLKTLSVTVSGTLISTFAADGAERQWKAPGPT